jgi:hypothetical protein
MRQVWRARCNDRGELLYWVGRSRQDGASREAKTLDARGGEFSDRLHPAPDEHAAIGAWAAGSGSPEARTHPHSERGRNHTAFSERSGSSALAVVKQSGPT